MTGPLTMKVYGGARLTVQGRDCDEEVLALSEGRQVLLGQVPLEKMDWWIDLTERRLVPNPEHGGQWMAEVFQYPTPMVAQPRIPIDNRRIEEFCHKWRIAEFSLFGSVLRDDFGPDSDVDVHVRFDPEAPWSLLDLVSMIDELKGIFGRDVDLVEKDAIRNPFRRHSILTTHRVIYAA